MGGFPLSHNARYGPRKGGVPFHLTPQETKIILYLSDLQSSRHDAKELAGQLGIKHSSTKTYIALLRRKLQTDTIGLILIGLKIREGMFDPEVYFNELDKKQEQEIRSGSPQAASGQPTPSENGSYVEFA